ncbi:hypothetical protein AC249_AIPGENE9056 [Exaiptasia diaphana]|nr:hypothetical protein AC249_AIPGENE9056 [Exaiptasia diaphana]
MVKTKFIEVSRNALTDKCESKGKKQVSVEGPCAKLKLPSICAITPDCMHIYCELKFAGQKVSFSFSINVCENPMTLSVGADIPTLHIHWEKKFKSKMRIPIPGYGFNAPGISGGVQIRVLLKPKRGRLQLKIKLLVGAKLGWAEIFPLKLTLVSLRLPIKIAGCGKTSLLDRSKKRITSSTPTTVVSHKRPTTSFTPTTVSHNLSRKKKQSNPTSSPSTIASTSRKLPRPTEDEDYDISFEE